jgi:hypothetical protein
MSSTDEAVSLGLSAGDIAWPLVLVMCGALMVMPFLFLIVALRQPEEVANEPPD